jgi:hypothetical protein
METRMVTCFLILRSQVKPLHTISFLKTTQQIQSPDWWLPKKHLQYLPLSIFGLEKEGKKITKFYDDIYWLLFLLFILCLLVTSEQVFTPFHFRFSRSLYMGWKRKYHIILTDTQTRHHFLEKWVSGVHILFLEFSRITLLVLSYLYNYIEHNYFLIER